MNIQTSFWDEDEHGLARRTDPETSHWAAAEVQANRLETIVAAAIRRAGHRGLIAAELPAATGLPLNTVTPRTRPLVIKGVIFDSGMKRAGPTGKSQIVWVHKNFISDYMSDL